MDDDDEETKTPEQRQIDAQNAQNAQNKAAGTDEPDTSGTA